ncbi:MAG: 1-acyl-sn-glycerol-3-phosphate acyltransferase [Hyphomicrobiaceae bacterium]|nr:1-acyl-sn-glycerol-3-phosphate acyltransferase [Hyphomicrobiaceae bacterium]
MSSLRAASILAGFAGLTLPLMPVQAGLVRFAPNLARRLPHWYHRRVCGLIGVRLEIEGAVVRDRPVLLVANHTSWLDIPVLSAVAPVSFVAKKEVAGWPGVAALARLQRTVFVDRERRSAVGNTAGDIVRRLVAGDAIVLFAEGTSSDGNRVLPFRTSLFAAAKPSAGVPAEGGAGSDAVVQTVAIAYTRLHGVPISRADRSLVGWYGDMDLPPHAWALLKAGPIDARIVIGAPQPLDSFDDRKALARHSEDEVRSNVIRSLRGLPAGTPICAVRPSQGPAPVRRRRADQERSKRMV